VNNLRTNLWEMVERYKFWSFGDAIEALESHAKSCVIKQIPSFIAQTMIPSKPNEKPQDETQADADAKKKLFGSFAK